MFQLLASFSANAVLIRKSLNIPIISCVFLTFFSNNFSNCENYQITKGFFKHWNIGMLDLDKIRVHLIFFLSKACVFFFVSCIFYQ